MSIAQNFDSQAFYAKHGNKTVFIGISYLDPFDGHLLGQHQIFGTFHVPDASEDTKGICVKSCDGNHHFFDPELASLFEAPRGVYHLQLHANPVEDPDFLWLRDIYAH